MSQIQRSAEAASADLALVRGNFPCFDHSIFPKRGVRLRRNATLTTVAPTGTLSLIAGSITSYNVCYTKLLRPFEPHGVGVEEDLPDIVPGRGFRQIDGFGNRIVRVALKCGLDL